VSCLLESVFELLKEYDGRKLQNESEINKADGKAKQTTTIKAAVWGKKKQGGKNKIK
jgi:hypothetical protein